MEFPFCLSCLEGDYNFAGFKKQFWKFESIHKLTVITEEMSQTTILTYDDPDADFVLEMLSPRMLEESFGWERISEKKFDTAVQRLIDKLFKA